MSETKGRVRYEHLDSAYGHGTGEGHLRREDGREEQGGER